MSNKTEDLFKLSETVRGYAIYMLVIGILIHQFVACILKGRKSAAAPICLQRSTLSTCQVIRCPGVFEGAQRDLGPPDGLLGAVAPNALFPKRPKK